MIDSITQKTYIKVFELELGQTLIEGLLDVVGVVLAVPQLGGLGWVSRVV